MAKQIKIKEIAALSGVSAGTVDRILHGRGNVSPAKQAAVEEVLARVGYKFNIHTSAVSLRKTYRLIITTPEALPSEYWGALHNGISKAVEEYADIAIQTVILPYNQFDEASCRETFARVLDEEKADGVLIGPTFRSATLALCAELDSRKVPYIFVDADVEGTAPVASFSTDQDACGRVVGQLVANFLRGEGRIAYFRSGRKGEERSGNTLLREKGLQDFFSDHRLPIHLERFVFDQESTSRESVLDFFRARPDIHAAVVLNSRGHLIADILHGSGLPVYIIGFDPTGDNVRCLRDGSISVLLGQRPEMQGYFAVETMIRHLLYKTKDVGRKHLVPIDILLKENLPYYREVFTL